MKATTVLLQIFDSILSIRKVSISTKIDWFLHCAMWYYDYKLKMFQHMSYLPTLGP
jgi:hypothetical protein